MLTVAWWNWGWLLKRITEPVGRKHINLVIRRTRWFEHCPEGKGFGEDAESFMRFSESTFTFETVELKFGMTAVGVKQRILDSLPSGQSVFIQDLTDLEFAAAKKLMEESFW
jgi:hypothetical protein